VILRDGLVVGTWRLDRSRATPVVEVTPFEALDSGRLDAEVADLGRCLGETSTPAVSVV
jgi:hypothetical protein